MSKDQIIGLVIAWSVGIFVLYFLLSFIVQSLNVVDWGMYIRAVYTLLSVAYGVVVFKRITK